MVAVIGDETEGGVDTAFEIAGIGPAFDAAVQKTRHGGTITVGSFTHDDIAVHLDEIVLTERTVKGTFYYEIPPCSFRTEFDAIIGALASGRLDPGAK